MTARYRTAFTLYPYHRVAGQSGPPQHHQVVVVGGGPVGLTLALDLGQKGTPVLLLDDHEGPGLGSKAICFSKRTLDIAHRLGAAQAMTEKGVVWNLGRVFHGDGQLFSFDLLPEEGHRNPAFINLQQPYFEMFLWQAIERAISDGAPIEVRGGNRVTGISGADAPIRVDVDTPDGPYALTTDWLIACDGAKSPLRGMLDLGFEGREFQDHFLIADVRMKAAFPTERWFWFQPPFADGAQSALLHKQPDDIWRIDFQLGWDIDRQAELDPDRIRTRIDSMLSQQNGAVPDYELVWTSIYTFQCRRMRRFREGHVFFAGDSAHQVSPFGARGANSGVQDADNLAWKLDLVCKGRAPDTLLDSYCTEREAAADENILNSSRATDFMTPKNGISRVFRDAVLDLAGAHAFARPLVNSGRLSTPFVYRSGPDELSGPSAARPGAACPDASLGDGFLLDHLGGDAMLLLFGETATAEVDLPVRVLRIARPGRALAERYLGTNTGAVYLIRPDQHVVARWSEYQAPAIAAALNNMKGIENG